MSIVTGIPERRFVDGGTAIASLKPGAEFAYDNNARDYPTYNGNEFNYWDFSVFLNVFLIFLPSIISTTSGI